jgi:hypothetical protein
VGAKPKRGAWWAVRFRVAFSAIEAALAGTREALLPERSRATRRAQGGQNARYRARASGAFRDCSTGGLVLLRNGLREQRSKDGALTVTGILSSEGAGSP